MKKYKLFLQQKIESAPVLTREALAQRQAAAELNRQKVIHFPIQTSILIL